MAVRAMITRAFERVPTEDDDTVGMVTQFILEVDADYSPDVAQDLARRVKDMAFDFETSMHEEDLE